MADADTTPKTRAKPGRKPSTPNLENVIAAIGRGDYDSDFLKLSDAIKSRNHVREDAVLKLVRETYGDNANIVMGEGEVVDSTPKANPFLNKSKAGEPVKLPPGMESQPAEDALSKQAADSAVDPLAHLDATEAEMAAEREEPSAGAQIPAQTVQVQPDIEMRGAAISGLHSSDIE